MNTIHISIIPYLEELFSKDKEEKLQKGFDFKYSFYTTVNDLFQYAFCFSKNPFLDLKKLEKKSYDEDAPEHFLFEINDDFLPLKKDQRLIKFIRNFNIKNNLVLYFTPLAGGRGVDEINSIKFFLHSNEKSHTPHIHAKYQGDEISIDLITFKIKGEFKNKKKQKNALTYAKENQSKWIDSYKKYTNGIKFEPFFLEDNKAE